jgi:hypothetical protein
MSCSVNAVHKNVVCTLCRLIYRVLRCSLNVFKLCRYCACNCHGVTGGLHAEIEKFCEYVELQQEEVACRDDLVQLIQTAAIERYGPTAEVHICMYTSFMHMYYYYFYYSTKCLEDIAVLA